MDINNYTATGHLTADPEVRFTPSGTPYAKFSIAVNKIFYNRNKEKQEKVSFFHVIVWGKQGSNCGSYLSKGSYIAIVGELEQLIFKDKNTGANRSIVQIVARSINFLKTKRDNSMIDSRPKYSASQNSPDPDYDYPDNPDDEPEPPGIQKKSPHFDGPLDDDIPF